MPESKKGHGTPNAACGGQPDVIPECPHCGGALGVYVNEHASGWCQRMWMNKFPSEVNTDRLDFTFSRRIRCLECDHVRTDVVRVYGGIAVKGSREHMHHHFRDFREEEW